MIDEIINNEIKKVAEKAIPEKRKVKKAVGHLVTTEPTKFKKLKDVFFEEDFGTVKDSVIRDIIVPTTKNLFADIFIGAIERAFYGSSKRGSKSGYTDYSSGLIRTHTASGTTFGGVTQKKQESESHASRKKVSIDELIYPDWAAAQDLADKINEEIAEHNTLTISQLYEMITPDNEVPPIDFTDTYYGWNQKNCAYVKPHGRFFRVVLPRPVQLT